MFTKLFKSIVTSTIWCEKKETKIVWVTMLALANRNGVVEASVPGLARAAGVEIHECLEALRVLESPDEYSRSKEAEGRRIDRIEGGWLLLNYAKYRALRDDDDQREKVRVRVAKHRSRTVPEHVTVTPCNAPVTLGNDKKKEDEEEKDPPKPPRGRRARRVKAPETELPIDWAPTAEHKARASRDGLNLVREADRFRSHAESKGVTALNWNARFTTWLINALDYRERDGRAPAQQTTPAKPVVMLADMTREQKDAYKQQQRDLEAWAKEQARKQAEARELASGTFSVPKRPGAPPETEDAFKGHPRASNGAS